MNIFEQAKPLSIAPFYFKEVGDEVQGTYIGMRGRGTDGNYERDNYNNEIITYELQVSDGIRNVSFGITKKIHDDMKHVKFGQIIGFKYMNRGTFMKNGKETEFKNIKVFADEKIVDTEWLKMHSGGATNDSGAGILPVDPAVKIDFGVFNGPVETIVMADEPFASESSSPEQKLKAISDLAKSKLGIIDPSVLKEKVMEATGMAFLPVNYDAIIANLSNK